MVYKDSLVVDAVTHAYDLTEDNYATEDSEFWANETYDLHAGFSTDRYTMERAQMLKKQSPEELERILFLESDVDYCNYHSLTISHFDELIPLETGIGLRNRNPERVTLFGDVNPFAHNVPERVRYLAEDVDVDGIKLYPTHYRNGQHLSAKLTEPHVREIIDLAADYGIKRVGIHKAQPLFQAPTEYFKLEDAEETIIDYPELTFEIVHTGFSFLEDTIWILARHDNVYANFETVAPWAVTRPRHFAEILGELLYWAGPDRLMFGSGCVLFHPQAMIEALWDFEMPADLRDKGYPELTREIKEKILGHNAIEYFGLDPDELRETVENDEWAERKARRDERPDPWSSIEPAE